MRYSCGQNKHWAVCPGFEGEMMVGGNIEKVIELGKECVKTLEQDHNVKNDQGWKLNQRSEFLNTKGCFNRLAFHLKESAELKQEQQPLNTHVKVLDDDRIVVLLKRNNTIIEHTSSQTYKTKEDALKDGGMYETYLKESF